MQARQRQLSNPKPTGPLAALSSTWHALAILRRSQLFVRLTLVLMAGAVVSEGLNDVLIQYLQLKLGFGAKDVVRKMGRVCSPLLTEQQELWIVESTSLSANNSSPSLSLPAPSLKTHA